MPKPESPAPAAPAEPAGAVPQAVREGSSRWNALEIGFFSAGDTPPPHDAKEDIEAGELIDPGETERVFRLGPLTRLWGAAPWRRLRVDWKAIAVVFGPGTLIGIVLLFAGGVASDPAPPPTAIPRVLPASPMVRPGPGKAALKKRPAARSRIINRR